MTLTRRRFLQIGALGFLAIPLVGCGGPPGPVSKVPAETLRVAYGGLQPTLDPHAWSSSSGPRTLAPMFDALTFIQSDGKLRPSLAIAWIQKAPTIWQFRLRVAEAKFHNGEMFTPESVRFSYERLLNARLPLSRLVAGIERVDIVDPATVNLTTKEPDPNLPRWVSSIYLLPPRFFTQMGERGFAEQPVGTGFWMLDDFQPGQHLYLNVFRDTWRNNQGAMAPPPLKRLELQVAQSPAARVEALKGLDVDVATELTCEDAVGLRSLGFAAETASFDQLNAADAGWQAGAFGAPLGSSSAVYASAANIKGVTALPNGSWWFDRVTKTTLQRIAVAGGA